MSDIIDDKFFVNRTARLVQFKSERSAELDARKISRDIDGQLTRDPIFSRIRRANNEEITFAIGERDELTVAIAKTERSVGDRDADSGRIIGWVFCECALVQDDALEDEVSAETLTGDGEDDVISF